MASNLLQGLVLYGYLGIAVFLIVTLRRLFFRPKGQPYFNPEKLQGSPFNDWDPLSLVLMVLAIMIIAWPFAILIWCRKENPKV